MSAHPGPGHVFVARGSLEIIDADAVVVPTDANFRVEHRWDGLWAAREVPTKPSGWGRGSAVRWDQAPADGPAIWFIDVAVHEGESPDQVITKIAGGVESIFRGCVDMTMGHNRTRPLIALPTLGVGLGGLGGVRGDLIARLLRSCAAGAGLGLDVVVVAYDSADYAAFQYLRRQASAGGGADLDQAVDHGTDGLSPPCRSRPPNHRCAPPVPSSAVVSVPVVTNLDSVRRSSPKRLQWAFVGQVERGQRNLTLHNILKLAHGPGVDPGFLVSGMTT